MLSMTPEPRRMSGPHNLVRLEIRSTFDLLDFVQSITDCIGPMTGFDEDTTHWIGVAVRESVINAIKHGNKGDDRKRVMIDFALTPTENPSELIIEVSDQGTGFAPEEVPNPLAQENLLKSSGRGIFFMSNFMDRVAWEAAPGGGTLVRMVKRIANGTAAAAHGGD